MVMIRFAYGCIMRTTDLYYFSVVAKAKSLTQASEMLKISQPSLSLRIKNPAFN